MNRKHTKRIIKVSTTLSGATYEMHMTEINKLAVCERERERKRER